MTVKELITLLQDGCAKNIFAPETRVVYLPHQRRGRRDPINLQKVELGNILDAEDNDSSLYLPPNQQEANRFLIAIAEDEGVFLQEVLERISNCAVIQ